MTPGAEAEVRRWMKQVLGYIRSLTWAMWSEHELSCSIGVSNVRIGGQDSVCNNPSLFIYTHSGLNTDTVNDLIVSVCNVQCGEGIQSKTKVWKIPHFQKIKIKMKLKLCVNCISSHLIVVPGFPTLLYSATSSNVMRTVR